MKNGKDMRPDPLSEAEEREVERVLRLASSPALPEGAAFRLMARIAEEPQPLRVRAVPRPAARRGTFRLAAALPLAASLALGVYLGAKGTLDFMLPNAITGMAQNEDVPDELGGVGEAEAYAEESLS